MVLQANENYKVILLLHEVIYNKYLEKVFDFLLISLLVPSIDIDLRYSLFDILMVNVLLYVVIC